MHALAERVADERRIGSLHAARDLFAPIADQPDEVAVFAYLDPEWRLLGVRHIRSARADLIAVPVRSIAFDAISFNATGLVMAHNHPSGDCSPSPADIAVTRRLVRGLDALGVRVYDHLVLAGTNYASFKERGLL